jgi:hypothetical protein
MIFYANCIEYYSSYSVLLSWDSRIYPRKLNPLILKVKTEYQSIILWHPMSQFLTARIFTMKKDTPNLSICLQNEFDNVFKYSFATKLRIFSTFVLEINTFPRVVEP